MSILRQVRFGETPQRTPETRTQRADWTCYPAGSAQIFCRHTAGRFLILVYFDCDLKRRIAES